MKNKIKNLLLGSLLVGLGTLVGYTIKHDTKYVPSEKAITITQSMQNYNLERLINFNVKNIIVETGEAKKAAEESLETLYLGSCTVVTIAKKGEYGYLLHMSFADKIYISAALGGLYTYITKIPLLNYTPWGKRTNLIEEVIGQIDKKDLDKLKIHIIAPHRIFSDIGKEFKKYGIKDSQIEYLAENNGKEYYHPDFISDILDIKFYPFEDKGFVRLKRNELYNRLF